MTIRIIHTKLNKDLPAQYVDIIGIVQSTRNCHWLLYQDNYIYLGNKISYKINTFRLSYLLL